MSESSQSSTHVNTVFFNCTRNDLLSTFTLPDIQYSRQKVPIVRYDIVWYEYWYDERVLAQRLDLDFLFGFCLLSNDGSIRCDNSRSLSLLQRRPFSYLYWIASTKCR